MKKPITVLVVLTLALSFLSCGSNENIDVTGKWRMYKVIQNQEDVSKDHNPYQERYINFNENDTFESGGRPSEKNTGAYTFNKEENTLFLDSDVGPEDDSQWKVSFDKDTMHWQGFGSEWAEDFQIIHYRQRIK